MHLTVNMPVWKDPQGNVLACVEKLKVMQENMEELAQLAQDVLDDAVLMGCDEEQVKAFLVQVMHSLHNQYQRR